MVGELSSHFLGLSSCDKGGIGQFEVFATKYTRLFLATNHVCLIVLRVIFLAVSSKFFLNVYGQFIDIRFG